MAGTRRCCARCGKVRGDALGSGDGSPVVEAAAVAATLSWKELDWAAWFSLMLGGARPGSLAWLYSGYEDRGLSPR